MENFENKVDSSTLVNKIKILSVTSGSSSKKAAEMIKNKAKILDENKVKFAFIYDGTLLSIYVNGYDNNRAKFLLYP
jgi:hypothetical protein